MKGFFWYPTIGLIIILPGFLSTNFFHSHKNYVAILNNISLIYHYSFLSLFIIKVVSQQNRIKYIKFIFLFFLGLLILVLATNKLTEQLNMAYMVSNLGLSIFCVLYYYQLFNNTPTLDLKREPSFWVITGVFFCMSLSLPATSVMDNLMHSSISFFTLSILYNTVIFSYLVMHLFFIKACLCSVRPQKL